MTSFLDLLVNLSAIESILIKITVLLVLGWAAHFTLLRTNPRWRVLLWRAVLVGTVLIPLLESFAFFEVTAAKPAESSPVSSTRIPFPVSDPSDSYLNDSPPDRSVVAHLASHSIERLSTSPSLPVWRKESAKSILFLVWLSVVLVLSIRFYFAYTKIRRIVASSSPGLPKLNHLLDRVRTDLRCRNHISLRISKEIPSPLLLGIREHFIIMPEEMLNSWRDDEIRAVFAHEIGHLLKTQDLPWILGTRWINILLWFHPLVWRIQNAHDDACEEVCDAIAAEYLGDTESYTATLARIALLVVPRLASGWALPLAGTSQISRRLRALSRRIDSTSLRMTWVLTVCSLGLGCVGQGMRLLKKPINYLRNIEGR